MSRASEIYSDYKTSKGIDCTRLSCEASDDRFLIHFLEGFRKTARITDLFHMNGNLKLPCSSRFGISGGPEIRG